MLKYDYTNQTIIVTGGTRGIGAAITRSYLEAGATVIATYARNQSAAEEFAEGVGDLKEKLDLQSFDVSKYDEVEKFFKYVDEKYPTIEVVINNAGIRKDNIVGMMPSSDWQQVLDINLTGCFNICKFAVQKMMTNRYGRIINITSPSGKVGFQGQANYAASKAGMVAMTKSLAKEVAKRKITVNCVSPGFISTELIADLPAEQVKGYKKMVPMKRFGTPAEIASAVMFLSSSAAAYITGATLEVTGGL